MARARAVDAQSLQLWARRVVSTDFHRKRQTEQSFCAPRITRHRAVRVEAAHAEEVQGQIVIDLYEVAETDVTPAADEMAETNATPITGEAETSATSIAAEVETSDVKATATDDTKVTTPASTEPSVHDLWSK